MRRTDPSGAPGGTVAGRPPVPLPIGAPGRPAGAPKAPAAVPPAPSAEEAAARAAPASRSTFVAEVVTGSLLMAIGWLALVSSVRMGIGWGSDGPQSGFVPFWLSTVLISCSANVIVHAVRRRGAGKRFVGMEQLRRVLTVAVPAAAMVALTRFLGLYVAAALYMGFTMRWSGRHSWALSIALPLAFVLVVFVVFERWFLVPLPKGPVEAWLGH